MFKNLSPWALGVTGHQSEVIELALTYGFEGMDLNAVDFANRVKLRGMPYARRLIDSAKIRLGAFRLPFDWDTEDEQFEGDLEKLRAYGQAAAEVGCTRCVATVAPAGDKRPYHENFEFHRRRLAEICEVLQPPGVSFGVGFRAGEHFRRGRAFQFIHDLDALTLLVNMVDCPNVGVLLDTWELIAGGGSVEAIRNLPVSQIVAVQIADLPVDVPLSEVNEHSRLLPGAANSQIDTAGVLVTLAEMGYDGPVTPAPSRRVFQSRRRDAIVRQTGDAMEKVWRAAGLGSERLATKPAGPAENR